MNANSALLNLEIIYEALVKHGLELEYHPADEMPGLRDLRFYDADNNADMEDYLLLCPRERGNQLPEAGSLLLLGEWTSEEFNTSAAYLLIDSPFDLYHLINILQELFAYYENLEDRLTEILSKNSSLTDICTIGLNHFNCPVFVHDEYYYILACPQLMEGKTNFDYNAQAGHYMQDSQTLVQFQTSVNYQETLKTHGGQFWDSDFNDEQCLYCNIWIDKIYKGRLIVLDTEPTPGKLRVVTYLGGIITQAILNRYMDYIRADGNPLRQIVINGVEGTKIDFHALVEETAKMGWKVDDQYICGKINFVSDELSRLMVFGICNEIQLKIKGSYTCYYKNAIYILVNITQGKLTRKEFRQNMCVIIRESLLHIGVSDEFSSLLNFPEYIKQADIALTYCREEETPLWYNEFKDHALRYWLTRGTGHLSFRTIRAGELALLKKYDQENATDLYETLKTYLLCERKSTLTAQVLDIHRSTLPHRLERISELTGLDLEDFKVRLYLLMSFAVENPEIIPGAGSVV
ncbi:helix-turn-helix domain-containing protein [Blautia schinkii]|nr:helix-turn-helix domain-containing protein [Blautia schinkii]